ncbi:protoporphyrinogen IX oxidase [Taibaiella lutea]|uniref:Protoporphyrinogen IX oxidase n=1 Tax=Taibaiella lutea TaxID=2608001 RepID=A0A5M6CII4_9BACT|nr:CopD family protein [Taibaiella lutea]KAA5534823.1 protoporphyrinogen IX oxidase [Taibaiella lutea]
MLYLKALHIIFIVTWFSGMFYIVRLFIYATEANEQDEPAREILGKQYNLMSKRLWYGITFPSAILTLIFGPLLWYNSPYWELFHDSTWLQVKLVFVILLYIYFFTLHKIFTQQQKGIFAFSSKQLRIWNEVATIFLVVIVMLAVVKNAVSWVWGLVGLILFVIVLMMAIKLYKRIREGKK